MSVHPQIESHSELFHRRAVYLGMSERARLVDYFSQLLNAQLVDYQDPRLVTLAHQDPQAFLEHLASQSERPYLFFKVFPRHLDWERLESHVLSKPDIVKLFLFRDPLQTFVSFQLGRLSETWSHQDTSSMSVDIDVNELLEFTDRHQTWQRRCESTLQSLEQPYATIHYEALRGLKSHGEVLDMMRSALESLGVSLDPVPAEAFEIIRIRPIQNRRTHVRESISNFDEVIHRLDQRGRRDLIEPHLS